MNEDNSNIDLKEIKEFLLEILKERKPESYSKYMEGKIQE